MSGRRILLGFTAVLAVVVMSQLAAYPAGIPKSIPWEETGPFKHVDDSDPHRFSHQLLLHQRSSRLAPFASDAVSEDVGDIAVIVDNGKIFIQPRPGNPFDLTTPTNIRWTRVDADTFTAAFVAASFDATIGPPLPLSDDDTEPVAIPFTFPFLGASYSTIHVNSDGNITLGAGAPASSRDAAGLIGGPPRIAPLFNDLNPQAGGSIHASVRATEVVITWMDVPEFGIANKNTFQLTLKNTGEIVFAYQSIDADFGVVGVAEGNDEGPINEIDLTTSLPATKDAGAIFEEFVRAILVKQIDVLEVAKQFYKTHPDKYDFLVIFQDSIVDIGFGAFAFHLTIKNQTTGLGRPIVDFTALVGSDGELESILEMNRIGLYWPDANKMVDPPIQMFLSFRAPHGELATFLGPPGAEQISRRARWFGTLQGDFPPFDSPGRAGDHGAYTLGLNSAMSLMGQEAGHRWMARTRFQHPADPNPFAQFDLLGRGFSHWSFFFNVRVPDDQFGGDPRASSMEGNAIVDLGPGASAQLPFPCTRPGESTFLTERNELVDGYTKLDQYLMGLRMGLLPASDEVGPFWYVDEPRSPRSGLSLERIRVGLTTDDVIFCGKRVNLTLANIQAIHGPRNPAIGDEEDTDALGRPMPDVKTMAFILVIDQGSPRSPAHAAAIQRVDTFRRTWQMYANGRATGGRGRFDTSLNPKVH